jgi:hypothetical protein
MPAIPPLRRHPSQTHNVLGINWANPITQGLKFAGISQGDGALRNFVTGVAGTRAGSAKKPTGGIGDGGSNVKFNGISVGESYLDFGLEPNVVNFAGNSNHGTVFMWVYGDHTTNNVGALACRNDSNSNNVGWALGVTSGKLLLVRENSSTNTNAQSVASFPQRTWTSVAAAVQWGAPPISSGLNLYIGGQDAGVSYNSAGSGTNASDSGQSLRIGTANFLTAGNGDWDGNIEIALFWNRILSAQEIKAIHDNRFQLFLGRRRNVYFKKSAGSTVLRRPVVMVM